MIDRQSVAIEYFIMLKDFIPEDLKGSFDHMLQILCDGGEDDYDFTT